MLLRLPLGWRLVDNRPIGRDADARNNHRFRGVGVRLAWFRDDNNRDEAIDIPQQAGKLDRQEVVESYDFSRRIDFFEPSGKVSTKLLGNLMAVLIRMGEIKAPIPMDKIALAGVTQIGE